jgi:hypothetical protein
MSIQRSQDRYALKVYLGPEAIAFLESKYPNLDPELGIVHLIEEAMDRARRTAAARVQVVEYSTQAKPKAVPHPTLTPPKLASQHQVALPDPSRSASNSIGALQEYCQQNYVPLPEYQTEPCAEGFSCQVKAVGKSASGTGANKKTAKANAAAALLMVLAET